MSVCLESSLAQKSLRPAVLADFMIARVGWLSEQLIRHVLYVATPLRKTVYSHCRNRWFKAAAAGSPVDKFLAC
jgi:hypothetical protein